MRQVLIAAFGLFMSVTAVAQHVVTGKVTDENNKVLAGATVTIQNTPRHQKTADDGTFRFDNLKKNHCKLEVSFVGFEKEVVDAMAGNPVLIVLRTKATGISEVTVNGIRANERSAVTYTNVNAEEIGKRNLGQDIPYLLAMTPAFVPTSDAGTGIGYTGFRIRGTDANRINMTVNGVPLNDAESHGVFFVNMADFASSLSSVQVQRGVGTSTNGAAAFGASINMQTETQHPTAYAEIASTYGSFNTNKNMVKAGTGLINGHFAFDARLSNVKSDGYIDRASVDLRSYYFAGAYYADKTVLKFLTFGGKEKTYQAWNGVSKENMETNRTFNELGMYTDANGKTQFYDNQTDNYNQIHYQLHLVQELNPLLHFNASAHYTTGLGYYEEYKQDRKYEEYGLTPAVVNGVILKKTDLIRQKWLDNYFAGVTFALNYDAENMKLSIGGAANRYDGDHYGKIIWVRNAQGLDAGKDWYRSNSVKKDANLFAKLNTEVVSNLFLMADLQYRAIRYSMEGTDDKYDSQTKAMRNITQNHNFDFFNPKVGLTYKFDTHHSVYGSVSLSNREPNRNNYTDAGANERPASERLLDKELGYRYESTNFSAGVNLYAMDYKNQLILTGKISEIGELLTSNVPDSYRRGIEFTVGTKINNYLKWDGNLALSRNKIKNFVEKDIAEYDANWNWISSRDNALGTTDIAYSPSVVANSLFTFKLNAFECGLQTSYVGKQYLDNTSDASRSLSAYCVNNLNLKYSFRLPSFKSIDLNLLVNNLFNNKYSSNGYTWYSCYVGGERNNDMRYFPQAGINFLTSVSLKF